MDNTDGCGGANGWCPDCGSVADWLGAAEAARMSGASERFLLLWAEEGMVHLKEAHDGSLRVCANSPLLM